MQSSTQTPTSSTNARPQSYDKSLVRIAAYARRFATCLAIIADIEEEGVVDDIAQDLVLECLMRVRSGEWGDGPRSVKAFVRTAVRKRVVDYLRRGYHREERDAEHLREISEGTHAWMAPDLVMDALDLPKFYVYTLASLPPICRNTYLMIREGNLSYAEVAAQLGVTVSAVRANVVRAQHVFRARLPDCGVIPPPAAKGGVRKTAASCARERSRVS